MKRNHRSILAIGIVILLSLAACGQRPQPTPIANPNSVEIAVTSTAGPLAGQTEAASAVTLTPSAVPTETLTPTPKISLQGTSLVLREDQSALFIDHTLGFQLTIPAGWLPTRVNEDEYFKAFTLDAVLENPPISDRLTKIRNNDAEFFRLDAIDIRPGHVINGMISDITVIHQFENMSLEEWANVKSNRADLFVGYQLISSQFQQTTNGTRVFVLEESWNYAPEEKVYLKRVFFSLPSGIVTLDFQTHLEFKDTALPDFEQVVNSLTLLGP